MSWECPECHGMATAGVTHYCLGKYDILDSGTRERYDSGMVRDAGIDKIDWSLVADGPMLRRYAEHLTKGARKYEKRNWLKAEPGGPEHERFRESAFRHFMLWYYGYQDEDHASATWFNINGAENTKNDND